jgi:hypothetical protein
VRQFDTVELNASFYRRPLNAPLTDKHLDTGIQSDGVTDAS